MNVIVSIKLNFLLKLNTTNIKTKFAMYLHIFCCHLNFKQNSDFSKINIQDCCQTVCPSGVPCQFHRYNDINLRLNGF